MGINSAMLFYPIAILLIGFAYLAIKFNNLFYSLISAILAFFLSGIIYYLLGSEYNAIIQIAIYGIAIPIILGLGIMFTHFTHKQEKNKKTNSKKNFIIVLCFGIFILALIYLTKTSLIFSPLEFNIEGKIINSTIQTISAISNGIFVKYVWAFELVSLLLTIVVAGLTLFKRRGVK